MTEDLLKRATEALREQSDEPGSFAGPAATRVRLLESADKRYGGGRRWLLRWSVAFASMFVVGTALARVAEYWPALREAISIGAPAQTSPQRSRPKPARRRDAVAPAPVVTPEVEAPAPEVTVAPQDVAHEVVPSAPKRVRRATRAPAVASMPTPVLKEESAEPGSPDGKAPPTAAPAPRSAELELFRRAHSLHVAHDPAALAAWDAYLRVAGRGALVPEARYNRALCWIRLARNAEARAALEPFARGEYGSYRKSEAEALLRALAQ